MADAALSAASSSGRSSYTSIISKESEKHQPCMMYIYLAKYNLDHQTAARTDRDFLAISEVCEPDLEAVAARARVVVDLQARVEGHVFDFDFVVDVESVCHGVRGRDRCDVGKEKMRR
jgi:hypothetical protein